MTDIESVYQKITDHGKMIGGSQKLLRMGVVNSVADFIEGCEILDGKYRYKIRRKFYTTLREAGRTIPRAKWYLKLIVWLSLPSNQQVLDALGNDKITVTEAFARCRGETAKRKHTIFDAEKWFNKACDVYEDFGLTDNDIILKVIERRNQRKAA